MSGYLRTKFQVSSIILTSFRQGVVLPNPLTHTTKRIPKKPTEIRVKMESLDVLFNKRTGPEFRISSLVHKGRVILELALKYLCYVLLGFLGHLREEFRIIKLKDANTFLKEETLSRLIRCMFNKEFENQRQNITRFISGNF